MNGERVDSGGKGPTRSWQGVWAGVRGAGRGPGQGWGWTLCHISYASRGDPPGSHLPTGGDSGGGLRKQRH